MFCNNIFKLWILELFNYNFCMVKNRKNIIYSKICSPGLISWSDDDAFTQHPEQSSYTYQLRPIILLPLKSWYIDYLATIPRISSCIQYKSNHTNKYIIVFQSRQKAGNIYYIIRVIYSYYVIVEISRNVGELLHAY